MKTNKGMVEINDNQMLQHFVKTLLLSRRFPFIVNHIGSFNFGYIFAVIIYKSVFQSIYIYLYNIDNSNFEKLYSLKILLTLSQTKPCFKVSVLQVFSNGELLFTGNFSFFHSVFVFGGLSTVLLNSNLSPANFISLEETKVVIWLTFYRAIKM